GAASGDCGAPVTFRAFRLSNDEPQPPEPDMRSEASMPTVTPAAAQPTDAQLVARAGDGDPLAFEAIMRRHNRLLFRTARSIASDDAQAQDAVQEAYLHAFSRLASFRGEAALGTWLARITINVALDAQRRNGRLVSMDDRPE